MTERVVREDARGLFVSINRTIYRPSRPTTLSVGTCVFVKQLWARGGARVGTEFWPFESNEPKHTNCPVCYGTQVGAMLQAYADITHLSPMRELDAAGNAALRAIEAVRQACRDRGTHVE